MRNPTFTQPNFTQPILNPPVMQSPAPSITAPASSVPNQKYIAAFQALRQKEMASPKNLAKENMLMGAKGNNILPTPQQLAQYKNLQIQEAQSQPLSTKIAKGAESFGAGLLGSLQGIGKTAAKIGASVPAITSFDPKLNKLQQAIHAKAMGALNYNIPAGLNIAPTTTNRLLQGLGGAVPAVGMAAATGGASTLPEFIGGMAAQGGLNAAENPNHPLIAGAIGAASEGVGNLGASALKASAKAIKNAIPNQFAESLKSMVPQMAKTALNRVTNGASSIGEHINGMYKQYKATAGRLYDKMSMYNNEGMSGIPQQADTSLLPQYETVRNTNIGGTQSDPMNYLNGLKDPATRNATQDIFLKEGSIAPKSMTTPTQQFLQGVFTPSHINEFSTADATSSEFSNFAKNPTIGNAVILKKAIHAAPVNNLKEANLYSSGARNLTNEITDSLTKLDNVHGTNTARAYNMADDMWSNTVAPMLGSTKNRTNKLLSLSNGRYNDPATASLDEVHSIIQNQRIKTNLRKTNPDGTHPSMIPDDHFLTRLLPKISYLKQFTASPEFESMIDGTNTQDASALDKTLQNALNKRILSPYHELSTQIAQPLHQAVVSGQEMMKNPSWLIQHGINKSKFGQFLSKYALPATQPAGLGLYNYTNNQ